MSTRGTTLLSCGCWKEYGNVVPSVGEQVICREHGIAHRVDETHYSIRCQKCPYSKPNMGDAPMTASVVGTKHALTRRHPVKITKWHNNKAVSFEIVQGTSSDQLALELGDVG